MCTMDEWLVILKFLVRNSKTEKVIMARSMLEDLVTYLESLPKESETDV